MIYKQFQNLKLSALGFGMMRLPLCEGTDGEIDEAAVAEMVDYAIKNGVNYFDTAWGYLNGKSEIVTGKVLGKYPRDSYCLASKFPGYDLSNLSKAEEIFEKQLEKCGVEYFDFYLFHNLTETNVDGYLDPKYGIYDYLMKQKANGRIRHLGFSTHGTLATMKRFLDAYGKDMEFCQIQLNYLDWEFQDAKAKAELLKEYNIPIWVMEPLRGGKLAQLPEKYAAKLKELRPEEGIPAWAFRFLQTIPEVTMTLSGMSAFEQMTDNVNTFSEDKPLNETELAAILEIGHSLVNGIPCTACRYCTSECPQELDIPELIKIYNEHTFTGDEFIPADDLHAFPEDKRPGNCVGCQSCEAVCPQNIGIAQFMQDFRSKMK